MKYGPDGGVYVSDWCDTGECHNYDKCDTTNGRIYQIVYGKPKQWKGDVSKLSDAELVKLQSTRTTGFRGMLDEFFKKGCESRRPERRIMSTEFLINTSVNGTLRKASISLDALATGDEVAHSSKAAAVDHGVGVGDGELPGVYYVGIKSSEAGQVNDPRLKSNVKLRTQADGSGCQSRPIRRFPAATRHLLLANCNLRPDDVKDAKLAANDLVRPRAGSRLNNRESIGYLETSRVADCPRIHCPQVPRPTGSAIIGVMLEPGG